MPTSFAARDEVLQGHLHSLHREARAAARQAHSADDCRTTREHFSLQLSQLLSGHPDWANVTFADLTTALVLCLFPIAAWGLDYVLLGAVAELFASMTVSVPALIQTAKAVIPLFIVMAELHAAVHRTAAKHAMRSGAAGRSPFLGWLCLSLFLGIAVPGATIAVYMARNFPFSKTVSGLLLVATAGLALAVHFMVIAAGKRIIESMALLRFQARRSRYERSQFELERKQRVCTRRAVEKFTAYLDHLQRVKTQFPEIGVQAMTFDATSRKIFAGGLGYDPFFAPGAEPATPSGTTSGIPPVAPPSSPAGSVPNGANTGSADLSGSTEPSWADETEVRL